MKQLDIETFSDMLVRSNTPIWRPIPSRKLANLLNVSLQSLANWRVRETGPDFDPHVKGKGNRTFYRPDKVLSWLSGGAREPWEFCRDWLMKHGLEVEGKMDRAATEWMVKNVDDIL